jgi:hypothetical protein
MAARRAAPLPRLKLPSINVRDVLANALRRPAATAMLVLVFAGGLGVGLFAHQVIAGDHHATAVYERAVGRGSFSGNIYKHQNADLDAIRDAEQAQMRSDGIIKGLLMVAVLLLGAIAVSQALALGTKRERTPTAG